MPTLEPYFPQTEIKLYLEPAFWLEGENHGHYRRGLLRELRKVYKNHVPVFDKFAGEKYLQWPHDGSLAQTKVNLGAFPGSQAVGTHLPS